jgi:triosephosphate isomerase
MKTRKKLVIGNWKMNVMIVPEAKKLVQSVKRKTTKVRKTDIIFCPPAIYLHTLSGMKGKYKLGAQNVSADDMGAHTGEISALQLRQFGVSYVIVGHSERRKDGETDEMVSKKIQHVLRAGMTPIVCIGEWKRDDEGAYLGFIKNQIIKCLTGVTKSQISDVIVMYEPVWCISPHKAMNGHEIHEMVLYMRKCLRDMFGTYADAVQVIYGGSVSPDNAEDIFKNGMADGVLPGRDSLDAVKFSEIAKIADSLK